MNDDEIFKQISLSLKSFECKGARVGVTLPVLLLQLSLTSWVALGNDLTFQILNLIIDKIGSKIIPAD